VIVEVHAAVLPHEGQALADDRPIDELQVPRRWDAALLAHLLERLGEEVLLGARGERELEESAHVHGCVTRLQHEPRGVQRRNSLQTPLLSGLEGELVSIVTVRGPG
jgi:hypothetical protein